MKQKILDHWAKVLLVNEIKFNSIGSDEQTLVRWKPKEEFQRQNPIKHI